MERGLHLTDARFDATHTIGSPYPAKKNQGKFSKILAGALDRNYSPALVSYDYHSDRKLVAPA